MKLTTSLFLALLAAPAFSQTTTTEGSVAVDIDPELSARVGTVFYSDTGMTTLRTSDEIKTEWSSISTEDQDAIRARCTALATAPASSGDSTGPATGDGANAAADVNFMADDVRMQAICEVIKDY